MSNNCRGAERRVDAEMCVKVGDELARLGFDVHRHSMGLFTDLTLRFGTEAQLDRFLELTDGMPRDVVWDAESDDDGYFSHWVDVPAADLQPLYEFLRGQ